MSIPNFNNQLSGQPTPVRASGQVIAPGISAVICDTGNLVAGTYQVEFTIAAMDTVAVAKGIVVQHRDAGDAANIHILGGCVAGESRTTLVSKVVIATNESIRAISGTAAGAALSQYVASISCYRIG